MFLVVGIASSLEFWRLAYAADRAPVNPRPLPDDNVAYSKADVLRLAPSFISSDILEGSSGKLHALAFSRSQRRVSNAHVTHVWASTIPEGSFYQLNAHVFVASPEFVFLNAATRLDLAPLIALGDELCGLYSFSRQEKRGIRQRSVPLVSRHQLLSYTETARGCPGYKAAKRALEHVVDMSASPMETFDEMTMCLPYRYGGYGLARPKMNQVILLDGKAARIAKRSRCYADMLWEDFKLDVEHHGRFDHVSPENAASDRARVNALREMGYDVIELTKPQVDDLAVYELIVQRIARITGKRIRADQLGATPARLALRRSLHEWNESFGKIC